MRSIELFSGAGGLALGVARAGFTHSGLIEFNPDACLTLNRNRAKFGFGKNQYIAPTNVRACNFASLAKEVTLVAGGPPCQPFSLGGKHRGPEDHRDLFPEAIRAVRELRPKAFIFENVKGLLRPTFRNYFEYVFLQLSHPEVTRRPDEKLEDHLQRLEQHHTAGRYLGLNYHVVFSCLNAADYGVPQKRERVFLVGFRSDLGVNWSFPSPTHSSESLLHAQGVTGDYWERHKASRPSDFLAKRMPRIEKIKRAGRPALKPWRTVRDVISDLPDPSVSILGESRILNHFLVAGARSYPGHTGSEYDEPAKVLKAGDHGVPGGENMLALENGKVRYFTVRESARLQTFPDDYAFEGSWTESMRQLGNAVPVSLGQIIASQVKKALESK